jgi:RNA polymerase sigma factor (sigma-70 family)
MPIGDDQLLREYALTRSETAFAELAARHLNWVHSAATRMLGDSHEAQDVTQAVFLLLAQQPRKAIDKPLASWLFQVLRFNVANARRAQGRRKKHEQEAATMGLLSFDQGEERLWEHLAPQLDELIARLRSGQREVLLMRFYQGKSMAEIGQSLKITEDAARKRVSGAVEQLRKMFRVQGTVAPATALSAVLLAQTTKTAPAALGAAVAQLSTSPPASIITLANMVRRMMLLSKIKVASLIVLLAALIPAAATVSLDLAKKGPGESALPSPSAPASIPPAAAPSGLEVPFQLGHTQFLQGDAITITSVRGTSSAIAPGNTYTITGTYELNSRPQATVSIFTTSFPGQSGIGYGPFGNNSVTVNAGKGTFSLELLMRTDGYPHVSFYPAAGGNSFGGAYFGTGKYLYASTAH